MPLGEAFLDTFVEYQEQEQGGPGGGGDVDIDFEVTEPSASAWEGLHLDSVLAEILE